MESISNGENSTARVEKLMFCGLFKICYLAYKSHPVEYIRNICSATAGKGCPEACQRD